MKMKRFACGALALLLTAALLCAPCAASPAISAEKAVLLDALTGRVLYEKDADSRALIASTTKIMTALLVCETCDLGARVRIPAEATGIEGSSLYLQPGEVLTVQELLYGMMLHSGNDAAVALAIHCGGSVPEFVERMNVRAAELELSDTHYANPNGLDSEENYSTARDLARLSAFALQNPAFYRTVSCKTIRAGGRELRNHNRLLFRYDGAIGVKTGYTKAAGRILVSAAERQGRRLICVTIHAPDDWNDHTALLDFGFSAYTPKTLLTAGETVGTVPLFGGHCASVGLAAEETVTLPLAEGEVWSLRLQVPQLVFAPVRTGDCAGSAEILIDGVPAARIALRYAGAGTERPQNGTAEG